MNEKEKALQVIDFTLNNLKPGSISKNDRDIRHFFITAECEEEGRNISLHVLGFIKKSQEVSTVLPSLKTIESVFFAISNPFAGVDFFHTKKELRVGSKVIALSKEESNVLAKKIADAVSPLL